MQPSKGMTFVRHLFDAYWQQSQFDAVKEDLKKGLLLNNKGGLFHNRHE